MQPEFWSMLSLVFVGYMLGRIHYFNDGRYKGFYFVFFNRAFSLGYYDKKWKDLPKSSKKFFSINKNIPLYKLNWKKGGGFE